MPIKSVHLNKSPMLVGNLKTLQPALADALGHRHRSRNAPCAHIAAALPDMSALWAQVYERARRGGRRMSMKTCTAALSATATGAG